ncbi:swr1-complex protein 5 [Ophiostoma piceae UAMH 11346]|uniref:SWR1-complex protein 5 n=1 Tax=Ophiostoma piceae (strain UAMH 11346) TaxID=1262450 RepID=S3BY25_OPHP1|nr:swr1-complex protein 5 [Ophiostoma piceae UAMH 11346]
MATSTILPEDTVADDEYASEEDSDFAPDNAPDNASVAESDDGDDDGDAQEAAAEKPVKKKSNAVAGDDAEAEDAGFENSGDEAIIGKGKKRRRKDKDETNEDGEGAGGFVKTRSQRANEKAERKAAAVQGPVTVDVDALWKDMMSGGSGTGSNDKQREPQTTDLSSLATAAMAATAAGGAVDAGGTSSSDAPSATAPSHAPEMIKIKRTYNFAGQVHTEEKLVARDSAEAKLYLAENGETDGGNGDGSGDEDGEPKRLPPRKAFRSAFEPVLDPALLHGGGRADLNLRLAARLQAREQAALQAQQAKKLTTVEKSRMDWAGFVDREGIQDELALAGKSKGAFVDRQQFLVRTEIRREEEARRARMTKKV